MTYSTLSEIGKRIENEDSVGVYVGSTCQAFFLADGLGGHGNGKEASESVVRHGIQLAESLDSVDHTAQPDKEIDVRQCLSQIFSEGHELLKEKQEESGNLRSMRTTLTALMIRGEEGWIAHSGDSRIYVFEQGEITFRTLDHSVPQLLAMVGEIKESEIRHHPDRNRLLRCMGDSVEVSKFEIHDMIPIQKGMAILMCSDGFWEAVTEEQMRRDLEKARSVEHWLKRMRKRVKRAREENQDNYSAIGIWF